MGHLPDDVSGTVRSVADDALVLSDGRRVPITPQTRFVSGGQVVSRRQVAPGAQVRASFDAGVDLTHAAEVVVEGGGVRGSGRR